MVSIENQRTRGTFRMLSSLLLVVSIVGSQFLGAINAVAASYTITWTSQSDFENGCSGTGCVATSSVNSYVDTSTTPGSVTMLPFETGSITDDFSASNHIDTSITGLDVATTSGGVLQRSSDLVGYWALDDSGSVATDSSGNGNNAFFSGSPAWVPGKFGQGLQLTTTSDKATVSADPAINNLSNITVSFWFKPDDASGIGSAAAIGAVNGESGSAYNFIKIDAEGTEWSPGAPAIISIIRVGADATQRTSTVPNFSHGDWIHAVYTYDGSYERIYANGALLNEYAKSGALWGNTEYGLVIGASDHISSSDEGTYDDVRVYDTALSADEIMQLYTSAVDGSTQYAQSTTLVTTGSDIRSAVLTASDTPASGSIAYYLSADNGATWESVTSGVGHTFSSPGTQLKYKIVLTGDATVSSLSIQYPDPPVTGTLSNIKLDTVSDASIVSLGWDIDLPANTQVKFRTRGATAAQGIDALYAAEWSDYITATSTGVSAGAITANGSGGAATPIYRYLEVEVSLISSDGLAVPTLNTLSVVYAINGPPTFNTDYPSTPGSGSVASQVTVSGDENWGKVSIGYSVLDQDTTDGTTNPNYVAPSFEYRTDSGSWQTIDSGELSGTGASSLVPVQEGNYTNYTAYWTPSATLYSDTTQVRVTATDNEFIYPVAYATTTAFTLDSIDPSATVTLNGSSSTSTVAITASDDSDIKDYLFSNESDLSADGTNATSGEWQTVGTTTLDTGIAWTLTGSTTATVYGSIRDDAGNTTNTTTVVPLAPDNMTVHDISNITTNTYALVTTWDAFSTESGATFDHYDLYRSTDGSSYSLLNAVSTASINYYIDNAVASTTTYYYKVRTVDTDGDTSAFSIVASATPEGTGGSNLPPVISDVTITNVKNTSAEVAWTTNTLTNARVDYGTSGIYGQTETSSTYGTSHSVYLTDLDPDTTYYLKVTSTDFFTNSASDDNSGNSYTFTTVGGPVITNVTVNSITDTSAHIFWNTDRPADSAVYYGSSLPLISPSVETGPVVSTSTDGVLYSHDIELTGLSTATTYYFYVRSTDTSSNTTQADNNNQDYSFLTTQDTSPPVISNITEAVITHNTAVIVWGTNEPATSQVQYGQSSGSYDSQTDTDTTYTISHVATLENLTPLLPYYYRVVSTDNAGNTAYSEDQTFTTTEENTIIVQSSGGGGGGGVTPDTSPPNILSVTAEATGAFSASIGVTTSPSTRAIVEFGEISSSTPAAPYTRNAGLSGLSSSKSIPITNLKPGTAYHGIVTAIGGNGVSATSDEFTFTTPYLAENLEELTLLDQAQDLEGRLQDIIQSALPSLLPPFVGTPIVSSTTEDSTTISWTTNIKAFPLLKYANEDSFGIGTTTYTNNISDLATTSTEHLVTLTDLTPNTRYHFSAQAFVFPQVVGKSSDYTFTTKAAPIRPQILNNAPDSFHILWTTDVPTTSVVEYRDTTTGSITKTVDDDSYVTAHDVKIENLTPGHVYSARAFGYSKGGNRIGMESSITVTTPIDTTLPEVSELRIRSSLVPGSTSVAQSIVSWTTDKPSTSIVDYGEGGVTTLGRKVENTTGYVTTHVILLPNLKPATIYRIQVSSTDKSGNTKTLPIATIVTPQQTASIVDVIFKNFSSAFEFLR